MRAPLFTPRSPRRFGRASQCTGVLLSTLVTLLVTAPPLQGQAGPPRIFELRPVASGVWVDVTRPGINPSSYANSVIIAGDSAVLVVDTHHSAAAGDRLVRQIRRVTDLPVRWVVNSHYHGDHVWGNVSLAEAWPEARFVAHPVTADSILGGSSARLAAELERLDGLVGRLEAALAGDSLPDEVVPTYRETLARYRAQRREVAATSVLLPDTEVPGELRVQLGGREVWIRHPGPAHTPGDRPIEQGRAPGAGMAFRVAGGVTAIPAAMAVWALAKHEVFALEIGRSPTGAVASGLLVQLWAQAT